MKHVFIQSFQVHSAFQIAVRIILVNQGCVLKWWFKLIGLEMWVGSILCNSGLLKFE